MLTASTRGNATEARRRQALVNGVRVDELGCWIWTGTKTAGNYGQMRIGGKRRGYTHRVSYELHKGAIPDGFHVDHLCRVTLCCNPEHLEAVPPRVNVLRSSAPGSVAYRTNRCAKGHEFTAENTIMQKHGRRCRTCLNEWQREHRRRRG